MDDFDGDGDLDIFASSAGLFTVATGTNPNQLRYFRNDGDGTFTDRTVAAGLEGLVSGLNLVQADYDNDGFLDLLVLRGAMAECAASELAAEEQRGRHVLGRDRACGPVESGAHAGRGVGRLRQ